MTKLWALTCIAMLAACAGESATEGASCPDGKCDGANGETCTDPRYDDGTCQVDLACGVPDIDCFLTFADDADAAAWYAPFEARLAMEEGRAPRTIVPASDPRYARMRELLDRGWAAFRATRPVGLLAAARPGLVVLDDPRVNAFVVPDLASDRSAFTVMVQTGAIENASSEEAVLGLVMHELQHAAALHLIRGVKHTLVRYYVAPQGSEPIGRVQPNDPVVQTFASEWLAAAQEIGAFTSPAFGGYPVTGTVNSLLAQIVGGANQQRPADCANTVARYNQLVAAIDGAIDPLSGAFLGDPSQTRARVDEVLAAAKHECLAGYPHDLIAVLAALSGQPYEAIEAAMPPSDRALVKGRHVVDGIANLTAARRDRMRQIEAAFRTRFGVGWDAVRYFSYEEDADDVTVPVMRAAGLSPTAQAEFLLTALPQDAAQRCASIIASGVVPPYGVDLADAHHATCWRAYHLHALSAATGEARRVAPVESTPVRPVYQLPVPARLADRVSH